MEVANQSLLPDDYLPYLDELNRIVLASGAKAEGNLFYFHLEKNPSRNSVYAEFYPKRRNFVAACRESTTMLEIGMNAGHSALLALACGVEYHGVDIALHPYVRPAAEFLKSEFGDRFHFYEGDSLVKLPQMAQDLPFLRFDLIHVDGHHGDYYCIKDTENSLVMALKNAWIILDDTDIVGVNDYFNGLVQNGTLIDEKPTGWEHFFRHAIGRVA